MKVILGGMFAPFFLLAVASTAASAPPASMAHQVVAIEHGVDRSLCSGRRSCSRCASAA
jgi:hypothetical protein